MREIYEFCGIFFGILLGIVLFTVILVSTLIYTIDRPNCYIVGNKMGFEADWSFRTQCMIKVDGKWINIHMYKVIKEVK